MPEQPEREQAHRTSIEVREATAELLGTTRRDDRRVIASLCEKLGLSAPGAVALASLVDALRATCGAGLPPRRTSWLWRNTTHGNSLGRTLLQLNPEAVLDGVVRLPFASNIQALDLRAGRSRLSDRGFGFIEASGQVRPSDGRGRVKDAPLDIERFGDLDQEDDLGTDAMTAIRSRFDQLPVAGTVPIICWDPHASHLAQLVGLTDDWECLMRVEDEWWLDGAWFEDGPAGASTVVQGFTRGHGKHGSQQIRVGTRQLMALRAPLGDALVGHERGVPRHLDGIWIYWAPEPTEPRLVRRGLELYVAQASHSAGIDAIMSTDDGPRPRLGEPANQPGPLSPLYHERFSAPAGTEQSPPNNPAMYPQFTALTVLTGAVEHHRRTMPRGV
jgi:hypothetical protein